MAPFRFIKQNKFKRGQIKLIVVYLLFFYVLFWYLKTSGKNGFLIGGILL